MPARLSCDCEVKSNLRIVCIDGDGAVLMHAGGLSNSADVNNLIHIVLSSGYHESWGGNLLGSKIDLQDCKVTRLQVCGQATSVKRLSTRIY